MIIWIYGVLEDVHLHKEFGGLAEAFYKKEFETILVVEKNNLTSVPSYIRVVELGISNSIFEDFKRLGVLRLTRIILRERPQIVIFRHPYYYSVLTILACRFLGLFSGRKTVFMYKMDSDGVIRLKGVFRRIRRLAWVAMSYVYDWLTIETSCGAKRVREIACIRGDRVVVVPNSYSSKTFGMLSYDEFPREPVIIVAARITRAKGLEYLMKAFSKVSAKHRDWSIRIAGGISDPRYYDYLKSLIGSMVLQSRMLFLGHLSPDDLAMEYSRASIFCLPSIRESFGIARVEAMACGLPVVTSDAGCGEDFAKMGCLVFPAGDVDLLASLLDELIANPDLRRVISRRQQQNLISWDAIAGKIYDLYLRSALGEA